MLKQAVTPILASMIFNAKDKLLRDATFTRFKEEAHLRREELLPEHPRDLEAFDRVYAIWNCLCLKNIQWQLQRVVLLPMEDLYLLNEDCNSTLQCEAVSKVDKRPLSEMESENALNS